MKSRQTALILAICLGWIGADKFYLRETGVGCLYWMTFGLFGLGWAWSVYTLWTMSDEEFDARYNKQYTAPSTTNTLNNNNVINIQNGTPTPQMSSVEEIKKLYEMKEQGIITEAEFEMKKKTLL